MMAVVSLMMAPFTSCLVASSLSCILSVLFLSHSYFSPGLTLFNSADSLSYLLLAMTLFLMPLMILSPQVLSTQLLSCFMALGFIFWLLVTTQSVVIFYLAFEAVSLPVLAMILAWGKQPERLQAAIYMMFYTLVSSLPFLVLVLIALPAVFWESQSELLAGMGLLVAAPFCVKLPMFFLHIWLPKAHVEAPAFGSMILAATLLKVGAYGLWRLSPLMSHFVCLALGVVGVSGAGVCAWVAMSQPDVKAMIAYSSVVHMGLLLFSVLTLRQEMMWASLMMMVSHGFCSSGLFYAATVSYEHVSTRSLVVMQGLVVSLPGLAWSWVLLILANLSSPPSLSLLSEVIMMGGLISLDMYSFVWVAVIVVMVLVYSLCLYWSAFHGGLGLTVCSSTERMKWLALAWPQSVWVVSWPLGFWLFGV